MEGEERAHTDLTGGKKGPTSKRGAIKERRGKERGRGGRSRQAGRQAGKQAVSRPSSLPVSEKSPPQKNLRRRKE